MGGEQKQEVLGEDMHVLYTVFLCVSLCVCRCKGMCSIYMQRVMSVYLCTGGLHPTPCTGTQIEAHIPAVPPDTRM